MWDMVDVLSFTTGLAWFPLHLANWEFTRQRHLMTITTLLLLMKILSFMRGFKKTAALLGMLQMILKDMKESILFLFIITISFGVTFYAEKGGARLHSTEAFTMSIRLMFGDFDMDDYDTHWMWTLWLCFSFVVSLIMFNLVIAIMGNSFDKVQETQLREQTKNRAKLLVDIELSLSQDELKRNRHWFPTWIHILRPKSTDDEDGTGGDNFDEDNRLKRITNSIKTTMEASNKKVIKEELTKVEASNKKLNTELASMKEEMEASNKKLNTELAGMKEEMEASNKKLNDKLDQLLKLIMKAESMSES